MSFQIFTKILEEEIPYNGPELRPHWIAEHTKKYGSAVVAFQGPTDVQTDALVDLEDREAKTFIRAKSMIHFLGEFFQGDLNWAIGQQRLFTVIVQETLCEMGMPGEFKRDGDDLFWQSSSKSGWRKLSVSIVTASPVSSLIHFGINLDPTDAPIAAAGLKEMGLTDWSKFAGQVLQKFTRELNDQWKARTKVIPR